MKIDNKAYMISLFVLLSFLFRDGLTSMKQNQWPLPCLIQVSLGIVCSHPVSFEYSIVLRIEEVI
jgi:hypothetical protein